MINQLLSQIQTAQNNTLNLLQLIPSGTPGRTAVVLAWEALRLSWYILRADRVGVAEKAHYVKLAYDALTAELQQKG